MPDPRQLAKAKGKVTALVSLPISKADQIKAVKVKMKIKRDNDKKKAPPRKSPTLGETYV